MEYFQTGTVAVPQPPAPPAPAPTPLRVVAAGEPAELTTIQVGRLEVSYPEGSAFRIAESGDIIVALSAAGNVTIKAVVSKKARRPKAVARPASGRQA
mgnify:CR=1 FL=1